MASATQEYKYSSVLLIDDSDADNFVNERMMEINFFSRNIYISTNGAHALDFLNRFVNPVDEINTQCLDLIFVDLNMPLMNGFEFIENLKKINDGRFLLSKVVILTSSINNDNKVKAENMGHAIIFANKPLTNEQLNAL